MNRIIDIVKFNAGHAYVLESDFNLTYEKHGNLLIGSDETNTFFDVLYYQYPIGRKKYGAYAFGGRKFGLLMKDGTTTHCWGQYWSGRSAEAGKILDVEFASFTHSTIPQLGKCYVFFGGLVDKAKLQDMLNTFSSERPDYKAWEYGEYAKHIKKSRQR